MLNFSNLFCILQWVLDHWFKPCEFLATVLNNIFSLYRNILWKMSTGEKRDIVLSLGLNTAFLKKGRGLINNQDHPGPSKMLDKMFVSQEEKDYLSSLLDIKLVPFVFEKEYQACVSGS